MAGLQKRLMELDNALEELNFELDEATNPWDVAKLEELYKKLWREYNMILKQIEA
jgi:TATA-binding protein-associated factor Taf7